MAEINKLNAVDTPSGSDLLPIFSQANGDARKLSFSNFVAWLRDQLTVADDKVTQYAAPSATGFTVTLEDGSDSVWLVLTPTGTMAAGTIKLPAVTNAVDKQEVLVNSTQIVTTLTIDANGATVTGGPTTLAANGYFRLRFDAVTDTWYRVG